MIKVVKLFSMWDLYNQPIVYVYLYIYYIAFHCGIFIKIDFGMLK